MLTQEELGTDWGRKSVVWLESQGRVNINASNTN